MLSISKSSCVITEGLACATPSIIRATEGSPFLTCEMPRIVRNEVPASWDSVKDTFGDRDKKSFGRLIPASSIVWAEKASTATGVDINDSDRILAVTTISSRGALVLCDGIVCGES